MRAISLPIAVDSAITRFIVLSRRISTGLSGLALLQCFDIRNWGLGTIKVALYCLCSKSSLASLCKAV